MLEAAAEVLSPEEMVQWHHRMENCENLSQGAEVTTQMIGRPYQFLWELIVCIAGKPLSSDLRLAEIISSFLSGHWRPRSLFQLRLIVYACFNSSRVSL